MKRAFAVGLWLSGALGCSVQGLSSRPGVGLSASSAATSGSSAASSASAGGQSSGSAGTNTTGAASSSGSPSTGATSSGAGALGSSSTGTSTAGATSGGWTISRLLATDAQNAEVWDLTQTNDPVVILQRSQLEDSIPVDVTISNGGDLLVLTQDAVIQVFADGGQYGSLSVEDIDPAEGLADFRQDGGPELVVVCGGGVEGFLYGGAERVDGGVETVAPLWGFARGSYSQCVPGPEGTVLAAYDFEGVSSPNDGGVAWFDAATGNPHGNGIFALSQGGVTGVAFGPGGQVLLVGDDGNNGGFAALFSAAGTCLSARAGGPCTLPCGSCVGSEPALQGNPLGRAVALGDGTFLSTIRASGSSIFSSNTLVQLDGHSGLGTSLRSPVGSVAAGGPEFDALFAWPQSPQAGAVVLTDAGVCSAASCPAPSSCSAHGLCCSGEGSGNGSCLTDCDCEGHNCTFSQCQ